MPRRCARRSSTGARTAASASSSTSPNRMPEAEAIRVLIADDHALFRRAIQAVLNDEDDIEVVAEAGDGDEAVTLASEHAPDVVLLDVNMPKRSGIDAAR